MSKTFRFSSSFRAERLDVTLARARSVARDLGISRVTDITRLDCIGVPVFASIRPDASRGSLCVNAGKGITAKEARVGAYMEGIEYAFAEYNRAKLKTRLARGRDVYVGSNRHDAILDFCPVMGAEVDLDGPIACVEAQDIKSREIFLVPAELIFLPLPSQVGGARYFGSNSNGLCSGNSLLEATVHGLAELIERDTCSFQAIRDTSQLVSNCTLPTRIQKVEANLSAVGIRLYVRSVANNFDIPYFMAVVADSESPDPIFISVGYGCHPRKNIAVTRAVCEALQSRLSFIHGGRDDLTQRYQRFARWTRTTRQSYAARLLAKVSTNGRLLQFKSIPDHSRVVVDIESALQVMMDALDRNGFRRVLRVVYTPKDFPLQVVRILVPGLECFTEATARVGLRLRDYVRDQL